MSLYIYIYIYIERGIYTLSELLPEATGALPRKPRPSPCESTCRRKVPCHACREITKGGLVKGGFSNNDMIITHKLLNPPLLNPPL